MKPKPMMGGRQRPSTLQLSLPEQLPHELPHTGSAPHLRVPQAGTEVGTHWPAPPQVLLLPQRPQELPQPSSPQLRPAQWGTQPPPPSTSDRSVAALLPSRPPALPDPPPLPPPPPVDPKSCGAFTLASFPPS